MENNKIKIGMHDGEFWGDPDWLDNSEIEFSPEEIEKINKINWLKSATDDPNYDPPDLDIERLQMAIDSGFKQLPHGLTPEEMIEYIMNDDFTNDE